MPMVRVSNGGTAEIQYQTGTGYYNDVVCKDCYAFSGNVSGGVVEVTLNGQSLGIVGNMNYSDRYVMYIYHVGALDGSQTLRVGGRSGGIFYVE